MTLWTPSALGSKLKLWLKGDTLTGSDGSAIATWADSSGAGNDAAGTNSPVVEVAELNGMNAARLNGFSSFFSLPDLLGGATQGAAFALIKRDADPAAAESSAGPVFGQWGSANINSHNPWTDGNIYDSFMSTERSSAGDPGPSLAAWALLGFRSATNDWRCDINATNLFTASSNTVDTATAPTLGYSGLAGFGPYYFPGLIAEVVYANNFLTADEKERVEGYLAHKWDLASLLPSGHTYKSAAPTVADSGTPVGLSVETDTAAALIVLQRRAIGLATETETALALAGKQVRAVGLAVETETALALAPVQRAPVGLAVETDAALARSATFGAAAGLASETNTALALAARQVRAAGLATETETALALAGRQVAPVGMATEGDQAYALAFIGGGTPGIAIETDQPLALGARQIGATGIAIEGEAALARPAVQRSPVGAANDNETALSLQGVQIKLVGLATETDAALALTSGMAGAIGLAIETEVALPLGGLQRRPVGLANENDMAIALVGVGGTPPTLLDSHVAARTFRAERRVAFR